MYHWHIPRYSSPCIIWACNVFALYHSAVFSSVSLGRFSYRVVLMHAYRAFIDGWVGGGGILGTFRSARTSVLPPAVLSYNYCGAPSSSEFPVISHVLPPAHFRRTNVTSCDGLFDRSVKRGTRSPSPPRVLGFASRDTATLRRPNLCCSIERARDGTLLSVDYGALKRLVRDYILGILRSSL